MPRKTFGGPDEAELAGRASMRPRPDAAENWAALPGRVTGISGFNEAAARCRGKPIPDDILR